MSNILKFPDDRLRSVSEPIKKIAGLESLRDRLAKANRGAHGLGVAAPQIGVFKRAFYYDCEGKTGLMINPSILDYGDRNVSIQEGCLSIPKYYWDITRPYRVTVQYNTIEGGTTIESFDGLFGRLIQHEIDHFDGILLVDHLTEESYDEFERQFFHLSE